MSGPLVGGGVEPLRLIRKHARYGLNSPRVATGHKSRRPRCWSGVRWFWILMGALATVVIVVAVAVFAIRSQMAPPGQSNAASCSPQPCADAGGYRMHVTSVQRGDGIVRLQVSFRVDGRSNMHADPMDFSLKQRGRSYHPYFDAAAGCGEWSRTQIPDRTSLGPKVVCFKPASTAGRLTLNWDPDLGITEYFSSGYDVTL